MARAPTCPPDDLFQTAAGLSLKGVVRENDSSVAGQDGNKVIRRVDCRGAETLEPGTTPATPNVIAASSNAERPPTKGLIQIRIFREGNWISHEVTHDKGQVYVTRFDGVKVPLRHKGDILSFTTQFGTIFTINTKTRKSVLNEPVELVYE